MSSEQKICVLCNYKALDEELMEIHINYFHKDFVNQNFSEETNQNERKRKASNKIANPAKKQEEERLCKVCNKVYSSSAYLLKHYKTVHNIVNHKTVGKNGTEGDEVKEEINKLKKEVHYLRNVEKAKMRLSEDRDVDLEKMFYIRVSGFTKGYIYQEELPEISLKESIEIKGRNFLRDVQTNGQELKFRLIETKAKFKKNSVSIDFKFSKDTDMDEVFNALQMFCEENENKQSVKRLTTSATEVRLEILSTIGRKVCKNNQKFFINFYDCIPILVISKKYKEYKEEGMDVLFKKTYVDAITKYGSMMDSRDFTNAWNLCKQYKIEDRDQFLVEFP